MPQRYVAEVTYIREASIGERPGENPAAYVALDELRECIIRYLGIASDGHV